jgi:MoxR-like ATPase
MSTSTLSASPPPAPAAAPLSVLPPEEPLSAADHELIGRLRDAHADILRQLHRKIVGQEEVLDQLLISFFSGGHALLVGVPGLAKTLMVRALSEVLNLTFRRIQFTPDLMPSDITGADVISIDPDTKERAFKFLSGPIFSNIILADELNRTPPKTQAALLEAMEEGTVHVGGVRNEVPRPFFVLATQNPIEQEGTYPLSAAAQDRFMVNIRLDYPDEATEQQIVELTTSRDEENLATVLERDEIERLLRIVRRIPVPRATLEYATRLVRHSRPDDTPLPAVREFVQFGGSPRATQALIIGAKARAVLNGRAEVSPADMRAVAPTVMRHRIGCNFHAAGEGVDTDDIVRHILSECPRPAGDISAAEQARSLRLRARRGFIAWLWGPDNRKTREAWALERQAAAPSRLEAALSESNGGRKLTGAGRITLGALGLGALVYLASGLLAFLGIGPFVAAASDTARTVAGSAGLGFGALLAVGAIGAARRADWAALLAVPVLTLLILVQVLMFAFAEGQLHESLSLVHNAIPTITGALPGTGFDWPALVMMGLAATPLGAMLLYGDA